MMQTTELLENVFFIIGVLLEKDVNISGYR